MGDIVAFRRLRGDDRAHNRGMASGNRPADIAQCESLFYNAEHRNSTRAPRRFKL